MEVFYQGFSFDTLLALISCITGIVALFLSGSAFKKCDIIERSFNDNKKYGDSCTDSSQKAARDINNYQCDPKVITETFKISIDKFYSDLQRQHDDNVNMIIEKTECLVQEKQTKLSLLKIRDWIDLYLENAQSTSDAYMQNVWAKVLANEIGTPGSFCFQTLGVLRNMSVDDFKLFEIMCSLQVDGFILKSDLYSNYRFDIKKIVRMQELGLLSGLVEDEVSIAPNSQMIYNYLNQYVLVFKNGNTGVVWVDKIEVYHLSTSALELLSIVETQANERYIIDCIIEIATRIHKEIDVSLHEVKESKINYSEDLLETRDVCFMSPNRTFVGGKYRREL